jgi:hypothetical protein
MAWTTSSTSTTFGFGGVTVHRLLGGFSETWMRETTIPGPSTKERELLQSALP